MKNVSKSQIKKKNVACFETNENLFFAKIMLWSVLFWYCKVVLGVRINKTGAEFILGFPFLLYPCCST